MQLRDPVQPAGAELGVGDGGWLEVEMVVVGGGVGGVDVNGDVQPSTAVLGNPAVRCALGR